MGNEARRQLLLAAAAAIALAAVASIVTRLATAPSPPEPIQVETPLRADQPLFTDSGSAFALSPDGKWLVYSVGEDSFFPKGLYLRHTRLVDRMFLTGTEQGYNPFFSPDGEWLGFVTPTAVKKVSLAGGSLTEVGAVERSRGACWGPDDSIVVAPGPGRGLVSYPPSGDEPVELTRLDRNETSHAWPNLLPGGRRILYTAYGRSDAGQGLGTIKVHDLDSGTSSVVHRGGTYGRYSPSGHLLFWREHWLYAAPFDLSSLELKKSPVAIERSVLGAPGGAAHFDVSADGTLVHIDGLLDPVGSATLATIDRDGKKGTFVERRARYGRFALSPDGRRLAYTNNLDGNWDIWILDVGKRKPSRLTFYEGVDTDPGWSANGETIYFSSERNGRFRLYRKPVDGSRPETLLPDGGKPRPVLSARFTTKDLALSPDGRWLAYSSDETGDFEVFVRPFPGPGRHWQVSTDGGARPVWTDGGRAIHFASDGQVFRAAVEVVGDGLRVGRPEPAFPVSLGAAPWTVSGDGEHLIYREEPDRDVEGSTSGAENLARFTFNWFTKLDRLLGE